MRDTLSGKEGIDLEYPHLLHGGSVKLQTGAVDGDGKPVFIANDTDNLHHSLPTTAVNNHDSGEYNGGGNITARWSFCEHWQIVMEPVGRPLRFVKSILELIIILRDTMKCHSTVIEECHILHCNISTDNILIIQPESGCM
ncbi:hypothetical protein EV182_005753 [Spiromyces aspiralis]|uniref:Uncharacterized protein n=1 Tax=Spiromyces aspiralis TaxID=68401 RepID=A0ACC1H9K2_9FUNG|nr:hypothetical protein EV182_005753 [Spiromyces aspiralis]